MQAKSTTSPRPSPSKASLTERLAVAEAAYRKKPSRRNLDRQVAAYHAWYWAQKAAPTEAPR